MDRAITGYHLDEVGSTPLPCKWCDEEGGDAACFASLVCPECGGVSGDGTGHQHGCPASPQV